MEITPFRIDIPAADVQDLRERLGRTRWPAAAPDGWRRGVPLDELRDLAAHWADGYDWRAEEAALNELPQFTAAIDGQRVHFVHLRSPRPDAVALLLVHGWPSTPFEFRDLVAELGDQFHLVMPSLPGYGFSQPLGEGWGNLFRVAGAFDRLMGALGYERYAVHATDAGGGVAGGLAMVAADRVIGVHLAGTSAAMPFGPPLELDGLSAADRERAERFNRMREDGLGYLHLQATRPQTLAYSLTDSPAGQLAWMVEKFHDWTDPATPIDRDRVLTAVSLFWFTASGASSAHGVYEGMQAWKAIEAARHGAAENADADRAPGADRAPAGPPMAVAVFATDTTIRSIMDPAGHLTWTEYDRGGHFPALEVPDLLASDIKRFLDPASESV